MCKTQSLHAVQELLALLLTSNILPNCVNNVVVIGEYQNADFTIETNEGVHKVLLKAIVCVTWSLSDCCRP